MGVVSLWRLASLRRLLPFAAEVSYFVSLRRLFHIATELRFAVESTVAPQCRSALSASICIDI